MALSKKQAEEDAAASRKALEKALEDLARIKERSEDDYEKNITYIAAGTLVLSLTFLEKVVNLSESSAVWFLIASWVLLSLTLLGNLVSHQLSAYYHDQFRELYAACAGDYSIPDLKIKLYNGRITKLNWGTTVSLFLGIAMLVTFCSINAYFKTEYKSIIRMSKEIKPQVIQPDQQKGRTISQPARPVQYPPVKQPATPPGKQK